MDNTGQRGKLRRWLAALCVLAVSFASGYAQGVAVVETEPVATQPPGYYLINLKYLSVAEIAAYFNKGGAYANYIPPTVEKIVGMTSLQSIAMKSSNPQDVLTISRLIAEIDKPVARYTMTCTVIATDGAAAPALPDTFATLPEADRQAQLRTLVSRCQATVLTYPELRLELNTRGECLLPEESRYYRVISGGLQVRPHPLMPAMPAFRLSHLHEGGAPTAGQFGLSQPAPDALRQYRLEKTVINNTLVFSFTGLLANGKALSRVYMLLTLTTL